MLEERLEGPEVSFFVIADGEHAVPLVAAQDHKRIFDDDRGPEHRRHGRVRAEPARRRRDCETRILQRDRPARCCTA